jgi:hypothetical protein
MVVMPNTRRIFEILLPTTFPRAISGCPCIAACKLTSNSGAEVPKATIVSPMIPLGILKCRAMVTLLSTRNFPLANKRINPSTKKIMVLLSMKGREC